MPPNRPATVESPLEALERRRSRPSGDSDWASVPTRVREVRGTAVSRPLSHDGVLDATTSPVTADAWVRRTGQVDCHVVARTYRHLSALVRTS